jgi:hypothetical protein
MEAMHRKFLVVGAGRSGTKYAAYLLQSLGLDIRHEAAGSDGIVSWYLAADSDSVPDGPPSSQFVFEHVFHQVRHPLCTIPSLASLRPDTWSFVARHTPCSLDDPLPARCAKLWLHWNEMAEAKAEWRYRIEDLPLVYEEFCERFDVPCDRRALDRLPRDLNTRPPRLETWVYRLETRDYLRRSWAGDRLRKLLLLLGGARGKPAFTWAELDRIDFPLSQRIRRKACEYGYDE